MNKKKQLNRKRQSKILICIATVLGLLLIYNIVTLKNDLNQRGFDYASEKSSMAYAVRDGDYPGLMNMIATNISKGCETIEDTSEYVALANYYEAMLYYRMYQNVDDKKTNEFKERADEYRKQLKSGDLIKAADQIDQSREQ